MDGNRRWAKKHAMGPSEGHKQGSKTAESVVEWCVKAGIPHVTLWALSTENWKKRSTSELATIFQLLAASPAQMERLKKYHVSVSILGNKETMSPQLRALAESVEKTLYSSEATLQVHLALNYGGRDELLHAFKTLAKDGISDPTPQQVSAHLFTQNIPDPELIVRTGGDQRLSGFMLWQCEYAELAFLDVLWPELTEEIFTKVLHNFAARRQNFGA